MNLRSVIFFAFCFPFLLFAQQEKKRELPKNAINFGVYAHTYGIGLNFDYWKLRKKNDYVVSFGFGTFKSRQEQKIESIFKEQGGKDFVFDKKNYFYSFSVSFGLSREILGTSPHNKISLRTTFMIGPTLGVLKPYYVEVAIPINSTTAYVDEVQYDGSEYAYVDIVGEADYFLGMDELKVVPGITSKLNFILDLSASKDYIRGIEFGIFADVYAKEIAIMDASKNKRYFVGGMFGLLIGNSW